MIFIRCSFCKIFQKHIIPRTSIVNNHYNKIHTESNTTVKKWRLVSAVYLERSPLLIQERNDKEKEYETMIKKMELERSLLSNHELRHLEDLRIAEKRKKDDAGESEEVLLQTALEAEDLWESRLKEFTPAPKITDADEKKDLKSLKRELEKKLILLVKQKLGESSHWVLPQMSWCEGESMRETANRALSQLCGSQLDALFIGNSPVGFYKYKFPSEIDGHIGAKVFFFKAHHRGGNVSNDAIVEDFAWLTPIQLGEYLNNDYWHKFKKCILDI